MRNPSYDGSLGIMDDYEFCLSSDAFIRGKEDHYHWDASRQEMPQNPYKKGTEEWQDWINGWNIITISEE